MKQFHRFTKSIYDIKLTIFQGCPLYIFDMGAKLRVIGWLGKKYDDSYRKNVNLKGKWWKIGGKGEIFTVLKKYYFGKRGRGRAKISYYREIYTPAILFYLGKS